MRMPNFFRKSYQSSGPLAAATLIGPHKVVNDWVCDTPAEFRMKLKGVFNLGTLKSEVISLVSGGGSSEPEAGPEEADSDSGG